MRALRVVVLITLLLSSVACNGTLGEPTIAPTPDDAAWTVVRGPMPVTPECCTVGMLGPVSPEGPMPADRWPEDGVYYATVVRSVEAGSAVELTLQRLVRCAELDLCSTGNVADEVAASPSSAVTRMVNLDEFSVVLMPIRPMGEAKSSQRGLEGSGAAFAELLAGLDAAFRQWVVASYERGATLPEIEEDLGQRSQDPAFPFGPEPSHAQPLAYRGPPGTYLLTAPSLLDPLDRWPPGYNGLYNWWTLVEIRDGVPILYVWAGQIGG
jgi:hypothetical protein